MPIGIPITPQTVDAFIDDQIARRSAIKTVKKKKSKKELEHEKTEKLLDETLEQLTNVLSDE